MKRKSEFSYWKKPWHKGLTLLAVLLQTSLLWGKVREYRQVIGAGIFTPEELNQYRVNQGFSCIATAAAALGFFGIFLIGSFAKRKWAANLAEALLLLGIAALLGTGLALWGRIMSGLRLGIWVAVLCLAVGVAVYTFLQAIKEKRKG